MESSLRLKTTKLSDRISVRGVLGALVLGTLLGGIVMLSRPWLDRSPLLYMAFHSAFSAMVLAALISIGSQDLAVQVSALQACPVNESGSAPADRDLCWPCVPPQLAFVTS